MYTGIFGYALCRKHCYIGSFTMQSLKKMILLCEKYAKSHSVTFNPDKSKLLCYNVNEADVLLSVYLNVEMISVVDSDKH